MREPADPMRLRAYSGRVYRNFATSIESQELTDDLTPDPSRREILKSYFYTKEETQESPFERVLKKSEEQIIQEEIDKKFCPEKWWKSRYSDGSWGVIYSAESEETALKETLFHLWMKFYREELRFDPIKVERRVLSLQIDSVRCVDLTIEEALDSEALTSVDESGYPYCQNLARQAIGLGAQLLRAPSARHAGGYCTPIFDRSAVAKDEGHLKYLRCLLKGDGSAEVTGVIEEATRTYHIF